MRAVLIYGARNGAMEVIDRQLFRERIRWRPDWRIEGSPLVFLDLETTGLFPKRGQQIVEAAILDDGGLRYHRDLSSDVTTDSDDERVLVRDVMEVIEDKIVVGHNIGFDLEFLVERARRFGLPSPSVGFIDTLGLSRRFIDDPDEELTLGYVAEELALELPDQLHRAVPDARLARDVFFAIADRNGLEILKDVRVRRFQIHE